MQLKVILNSIERHQGITHHVLMWIGERPERVRGLHCILSFASVACLGLLSGCRTLPSLDNRVSSTAMFDTDTTTLGKAISPLATVHPGLSGIYSLQNGHDAFASRILLARAAERTLDVQYYIWRLDMTGILLFQALYEAAMRGVRVRLLLDDNNTSGLDPLLAALDAHPNIEVRLFNPFVMRDLRLLNYVTDFGRVNRRMHNKSFTADSQATIIGGRNVGDEYFGAGGDVLFVDLDVLAVGSVVKDVSCDFDRYWASDSSYPVNRLLPSANPADMKELTTKTQNVAGSPEARSYVQAIRNSTYIRKLVHGQLSLEWAPTRMVSDDPTKGLGQAPSAALLPQNIKDILGKPTHEVALVSPYFVPTSAGVDSLVNLTADGVHIKVLTNSLEATDVAAVHAGYAKSRRPLLEAGVKLYELRSMLSTPDPGLHLSGSSASSLHAKTFAVDRTRAFVGSFNFDPRSAELNTEMGFVIDSPTLAKQIEVAFDASVPTYAYEVRLSQSGEIYWLEQEDGKVMRYDEEPGTSFWLRASVWILSLLPIEWLL